MRAVLGVAACVVLSGVGAVTGQFLESKALTWSIVGGGDPELPVAVAKALVK